jgi:hypothetical protein
MKRMRVIAQELNLKTKLTMLKPQMAQQAQEVYNEWEQDEEGLDPELGGGGICDRITEAIQGVIVENIEADVVEGGEEGSDHSWVIAYNATEACGVDIEPRVYESGSGYNWTKIPDVVFTPEDIDIFSISRKDLGDLE